ncbi:hypothetical protein D9M71_769920 [compost metagenome]
MKAFGGPCRDIPAILVVDHQPHPEVWRQTPNLQLQSAIRQIDCEKQMGFAILAVFAHIEQGNFLPVEQPLLQLPRGYGLAHGSPVRK